MTEHEKPGENSERKSGIRYFFVFTLAVLAGAVARGLGAGLWGSIGLMALLLVPGVWWSVRPSRR